MSGVGGFWLLGPQEEVLADGDDRVEVKVAAGDLLDELVGAVVLACVGVFVAVLINAGLLKDWFQPSFTLRILLPDEGVSGLAPGAEVQVLGTRAGEIRRIVIAQTLLAYLFGAVILATVINLVSGLG